MKKNKLSKEEKLFVAIMEKVTNEGFLNKSVDGFLVFKDYDNGENNYFSPSEMKEYLTKSIDLFCKKEHESMKKFEEGRDKVSAKELWDKYYTTSLWIEEFKACGELICKELSTEKTTLNFVLEDLLTNYIQMDIKVNEYWRMSVRCNKGVVECDFESQAQPTDNFKNKVKAIFENSKLECDWEIGIGADQWRDSSSKIIGGLDFSSGTETKPKEQSVVLSGGAKDTSLSAEKIDKALGLNKGTWDLYNKNIGSSVTVDLGKTRRLILLVEGLMFNKYENIIQNLENKLREEVALRKDNWEKMISARTEHVKATRYLEEYDTFISNLLLITKGFILNEDLSEPNSFVFQKPDGTQYKGNRMECRGIVLRAVEFMYTRRIDKGEFDWGVVEAILDEKGLIEDVNKLSSEVLNLMTYCFETGINKQVELYEKAKSQAKDVKVSEPNPIDWDTVFRLSKLTPTKDPLWLERFMEGKGGEIYMNKLCVERIIEYGVKLAGQYPNVISALQYTINEQSATNKRATKALYEANTEKTTAKVELIKLKLEIKNKASGEEKKFWKGDFKDIPNGIYKVLYKNGDLNTILLINNIVYIKLITALYDPSFTLKVFLEKNGNKLDSFTKL